MSNQKELFLLPHKFNMSDHGAIAGQLAEITKMITILATDQHKLLGEQTKISNEQSQMAMAHNQLTERLETME